MNVRNLLVTFDLNYMEPFKVMISSLLINNPGEQIEVWLLHSSIPKENLNDLNRYLEARHVILHPVTIDRDVFENAPIKKRYPQEMYYRLLAPHLLPDTLERVLYLDPDILIINPLRDLWNMDLKGNAFAAASHTSMTDIPNDVNRVRLKTTHDYYNTGVMVMDLTKARKLIKPDDIYRYVRESIIRLMLPDQDIFNALYGSATLEIDDAIWNYDVRNYSDYLFRSTGTHDIGWVMENTAILHFCGRNKPWKPDYSRRFGILYKHYMSLSKRS
ncbi:MAG: glycosyltransferase family 8 protein [Lachnospiraceae bacterium]|nr:glycosyltransferase family 8 protein [Lachnospiraceae bacterium]